MGRVIGIDLGTTNSLVAVWENGQSSLIPNATGSFLTPSIVSVEEDGTFYVGDIAKERQVTHPKDTVAVFKRFMGTDKKYTLAGKEYRPEELSALVLRKLKEDAENYLQEEIEEAVISVPAYFNDLARNATKNAGRLAGLKVDRIINEPSAAALAYQHLNQSEEDTLLVFDFGGGTLDVSLVDCFDNIVEILAVSGDNHLGGSDFDKVIADAFMQKNELFADKIKEEHKAIILEKAAQAKMELTDREETIMVVPIEDKKYAMPLSRIDLINLSQNLFLRMSIPIKKVLADAGIQKDALTGIILVGGSCKMPIVQKYIEHILGRKDMQVLNPDYMVALGVGIYAGIKERNQDIRDMMLTDICPFSLGTGLYNEADTSKNLMGIVIERNTALPASREAYRVTVSDMQSSMRLRIFQGEEYYADDNLYLGSLEVEVPPAPKGQEEVKVRFTYDINGILVVDATVLSTGVQKQLVIRNEAIRMSDEELQKKLEELNKLKVHPRDREENVILMERAARLYAETVGGLREQVNARADYFNYLLGTQDEIRVKRWRGNFAAFLNYVEEQVASVTQPLDDVDDFAEWYANSRDEQEEEDWEEEENDFITWKNSGYLTS